MTGERRPSKGRLDLRLHPRSAGAPRKFSFAELVNLRGHADAFWVQGPLEKEQDAAGRRTRNETMSAKERGCALLADRHLGLMEGVRGLLETEFEAVVVVGDEVSLFESARQLHVAIAVVDLSLRRKDGLGLIRQSGAVSTARSDSSQRPRGKNARIAAIEAGAMDLYSSDPSRRDCSNHRRRPRGKHNMTFSKCR